MADGGSLYPPVFMVDTHTAYPPPLPPRSDRRERGGGAVQTLLFCMVSLALCGMVIEAVFIHHLYNANRAESAITSKTFQDKDDITTPSSMVFNPVILPSKPVAHLTDGYDVPQRNEIMCWSTEADPLLYEFHYRNGKLVIQKEGYYYIYSKVFFLEKHSFYHSVQMDTPRYPNGHIILLESKKFSWSRDSTRSNSYLGGVFHLNKDDAIFVKVNQSAQVVHNSANANFFGAYMI